MKTNIKSKIFRVKYVNYSLLLLLGVFAGWLFFHTPHRNSDLHDHPAKEVQSTIWTCSMHPGIRMSEPGKCPVCGMDLIPLIQENRVPADSGLLHFTPEAAQLANVQTTVVKRQKPLKEVRLYGKVQIDERLFQSQVAHIQGRIEKLYVNFTGEPVVKGQVLATIYSPELVTAQQELLEAIKVKQVQPALYEAAREKLHLLKITDGQIAGIEETGSVKSTLEIVSNTNGIVMSKRVNTGDYVAQGTVLFEIADLSRVWIIFEAYESDLVFLRTGENISYTLQAFPGVKFSGKITFIDPVIDPVTRVAGVRAEAENPAGIIRPGMFAAGTVFSEQEGLQNNIVVPHSAILWTGKRSIVYVKQPGTGELDFSLREVELGPDLGESYVIISGLSEGEEIVSNGTFSVDAAAQLEGRPSMLNPREGNKSSMPGMKMPD